MFQFAKTYVAVCKRGFGTSTDVPGTPTAGKGSLPEFLEENGPTLVVGSKEIGCSHLTKVWFQESAFICLRITSVIRQTVRKTTPYSGECPGCEHLSIIVSVVVASLWVEIHFISSHQSRLSSHGAHLLYTHPGLSLHIGVYVSLHLVHFPVRYYVSAGAPTSKGGRSHGGASHACSPALIA